MSCKLRLSFAKLSALYANYRVSQKKCNIAISCLDLFQRSNLTFSHVFRNQNLELVPSGHITDNHSESKVP